MQVAIISTVCGAATDNNTYAAVIVTESEIEMPTVHGGDGNMKSPHLPSSGCSLT